MNEPEFKMFLNEILLKSLISFKSNQRKTTKLSWLIYPEN